MKHLILIASLLSFTSCASAYIREWGGGKVTACGNRNASSELLDRTAQEKCGGPATPIGGSMVNSGVAYVGYGIFKNTSDGCVTYACQGGGPAPASVSAEKPQHKALFDGIGL